MGCDIHLYIERKVADGSWVRVPDTEGPKSPYYDPNAEQRFRDYFNKNEWDTGRNYRLFGRLAGVRHYHILPIDEPRGVPVDMSEEVDLEWQRGQGDWHTPSWFTAKELQRAENEPLMQRQIMSVSGYKSYLKSGKTQFPPEEFTYGQRPPEENLVSNSEMERIINIAAFLGGTDYYTDVITPLNGDPLRTNLWSVIVPKMLEIESDPEKIRMVFWFDN